MTTFDKTVESDIRDFTIALISRPNVKLIDDVIIVNNRPINFNKHQDFSGFKIGVNSKRKKFRAYAKLKNVSIKKYAEQLGLDADVLTKYASRSTMKYNVATKLYDAIKDIDFVRLRAEQIKVNKILAKLPKLDIDYDNENKEAIRQLFISYLKKNGITSGKFFGLPSSETLFEIAVNKSYNNDFHYIACEKDSKKYKLMKQSSLDNDLLMDDNKCYSYELTPLFPPNHLSHAYVDYCTTYDSNKKEVHQMLSNKTIKVGGLIGFTFSQRDRHTKVYHENKLADLGLFEVPSVKGAIPHLLEEHLLEDYELLENVSYWGEGPMIFVLLKRLK